ncbi:MULTISPECIES: hypothetical protein [unclassified Streptomyces]|uniref:hypothetical protein n=1 Tax=unclassified Streptomyces TaxID=2593676 RepID=UPI002DDB2810|nr:hypothetical protein [Streptomyces sp. NBC_01750]WSA99277.1 hypothetical protein OIE54_08395 [Streptomyces sp. NBC_01794]WSD36157.1 hypothetical protein OG966_32175 [Streptomyces sp. NBC_01750]
MCALLRYALLVTNDVAYGINAGHAIRHGLKPPTPGHSHAPTRSRYEQVAQPATFAAHGPPRPWI